MKESILNNAIIADDLLLISRNQTIRNVVASTSIVRIIFSYPNNNNDPVTKMVLRHRQRVKYIIYEVSSSHFLLKY